MAGFIAKMRMLKTQEVETGLVKRPIRQLEAEIAAKDLPANIFAPALNRPGLAVIAEIKRASPSKGVIAAEINLENIIEDYQTGESAALSVLTDQYYFRGGYDLLEQAALLTCLPILHKEFIIHPWQLYRGRAAGASAALLIAALLDDQELADLYHEAKGLGMDCIVEVHNRHELERVKTLNPAIIGVNNRNLRTLEVDVDTCLQLASDLPPAAIKIAESGIATFHDAWRAAYVGFDAVLVGEALMVSPQPRQLLHSMTSAGGGYV